MQPGTFTLGCNYWASHAGTNMWADWRPDVVEKDLKRLAGCGIRVIRVFPIWSDFQPIDQLRTGGGQAREMRFGEEPLPDTPAGQAGMSEEMLRRFGQFAGIAGRHGIRLIVGLITGWMSGRLFVPHAFQSMNVLSERICLMWQARFVKCFVERFKGSKAVFAWDLGNECNCMAGVDHREAAWHWTATIANAIRAADPSRPVVSGMHSLGPGAPSKWLIQDQAELTDLLTTHPYPYWIAHGRTDPINTLRTTMLATAETRMYEDIGGKPCFVEETGSMGPTITDDRIAADFARVSMFSFWANDCKSFMWWCSSDQKNLKHAPYDWTAVERELGLFADNGRAKPVAEEMRKFDRFTRSLPFAKLPPRRCEAVCILTRGQDHWAAAAGAFVLAKQAKFDLRFSYCDQPVPDAKLYLLPSLQGAECISRRRWLELLEKVRKGATLYMSLGDGVVSGFEEVSGLRVRTRSMYSGPVQVKLTALAGQPVVTARSGDLLHCAAVRAKVLGAWSDGNPAFTKAKYGKGEVYVLNFPMERQLTTTPGAFHAKDAEPYWRIYREVAGKAARGRAVACGSPQVAVTEHALSAGRRVVIAINHGHEAVKCGMEFAAGWRVVKVFYGNARSIKNGRLDIPANDAAVLLIG